MEFRVFSLRELLRYMFGGKAKKRSAFSSEREAYDFVRNAYKETGGVTPELQRMFDFYKNSLNEQCAGEPSEARDTPARGRKHTVEIQLRPAVGGQVGKKERAQTTHAGAA